MTDANFKFTFIFEVDLVIVHCISHCALRTLPMVTVTFRLPTTLKGNSHTPNFFDKSNDEGILAWQTHASLISSRATVVYPIVKKQTRMLHIQGMLRSLSHRDKTKVGLPE